MTQKCEVCGQVKLCTRRDYSYPTRHFEINCDECHKKHCEEVKKVRDSAIWEAAQLFTMPFNREIEKIIDETTNTVVKI